MLFIKKEKIRNFFEKHFSFENNINLSDPVEVLFRRNVVIKNIILLSNLVYSLILFIVTFGSNEPGAWLFTWVPFPVTYLINRTVKKIIYQDKTSLIHQQVAMYLSSFYMFLSAILIYIKLELGVDNHLATAGYMLIFYSLIVVSLYQNRNMLKKVFIWMMCIVTVLHVFITHQLHSKDYSNDVLTFLKQFFTTDEFRDILFRTIVMGCFMISIYTICVIGEKMSSARTEELGKRQEIQKDFTAIVTNLFDVLINSRVAKQDDVQRNQILYLMTKKLASIYGYNPVKCDELADYSLFITNNKENFQLNEQSESTEDNFEFLRDQSELGTKLVKRIELAQKTQTIARAHIEGEESPNFMNAMNKIQKNIDSDILLLSDLYITLRGQASYKRPYSHKSAMESISTQFSVYFDNNLLERFFKFQNEFEKIYDGE